MKKNVEIYQVSDVHQCPYGFMGYKFAKNWNFSLNDYVRVFDGEIELDIDEMNDSLNSQLNTIFNYFNITNEESVERLKDYNGRSLSTSDVVKYDGKMFYCDRFDWVKIEEL